MGPDYDNKTPVEKLKLTMQSLLQGAERALRKTEGEIANLERQAQHERGQCAAYQDALSRVKTAFPDAK